MSDIERRKFEREQERKELGSKARLALEYVTQEAIDEIEHIQNCIAGTLTADSIDKDKVLVLTSKETALREFVKKVERRIKQS